MCKKVKPASEFYLTNRNYPEVGLSGQYLHSYCKPCFSERRKEARRANPKPRRKSLSLTKPCAFDGCINTAESRFRGQTAPLCQAHYWQLYMGKELSPLRDHRKSYVDENHRRCTGCDEVKDTSAFAKNSRGGYQGRCMACYSKTNRFNTLVREGRLEEARRLAETLPERLKEKYLTKWVTLMREAELERSNGMEVSP